MYIHIMYIYVCICIYSMHIHHIIIKIDLNTCQGYPLFLCLGYQCQGWESRKLEF